MIKMWLSKLFFILHTNYIVYFWLSVKTTMQPALDSLEIPILPELKEAASEKFQKHQNPKLAKKNLRFRYCWLILFCSSE